jgi:hypothetical protein
MPNLLHMYLGIAPEGPAEARAQMDRARAAGFTHARFIASGYWPADMTRANGWRTNPSAYWQAMDQLMADARARQLRLVPSLLWNAWLFPDLNNQPLSALFTPGSATRTMADQYVREFVQRYANEPAVAVWELGNEWNLLADLDFSTCTVCAGSTPNACGSLAPSLGTPCRRTTGDNIFSCNACRGVSTTVQDLGQWAQAVAQLIKQHDPLQRPVSSGHAWPRPAAWHLARSPCPACNWTADSEAEFTQTLGQLHPAPIDFISVHAYPGDDARRFGDTDGTGYELLRRTQVATASLGKRLYVGEYGEPRAGSITCGATEQCGGDPLAATTKMLALGLVQFDVALSALWAFDFHQFCAATPTCYGVESGEPLMSFLSTAERAALQCRGQPDNTTCATGRCAAQACAPVSEGIFDLEAAGSEAAWLNWTNCSSCTPASFTRVAVGTRSAVRLATNALPCTGMCQFPGAYALSPPIALTAGHRQVVMKADVGATGAANLKLIGFDQGGMEVSSSDLAVPAGTGAVQTRYVVFTVPTAVTAVRLRLEQPTPNAQLTLDAVSISSLP